MPRRIVPSLSGSAQNARLGSRLREATFALVLLGAIAIAFVGSAVRLPAALMFVANLVLFSVPAGLAALGSATLAKSSRDEWQLLAWVPVVPLALWALFIVWGVTLDPTSHNLWPIELVFWTALSLALFAAFLGFRAFDARPSYDWRARRDRDRVRPGTSAGQRGDEAKRAELARFAAEIAPVPPLTRREKAVVLVVAAVLSAVVLVLAAMKRR